MTTVVVVILVALLLFAALRLWITANRLDRLHVRTEAAWSALEGALARRIVATRAVAAAGGLDHPRSDELRRLADLADNMGRDHRADAENDLSRALATMPAATEPELAGELSDASERVLLARRFYNDAVRDTRALRGVWFTRVFRLAGRAVMPEYFEIVENPQRSAMVHRTAARVVLLDGADRVLLLSGTDPQVGSHWWHTPGGGVEEGEDIRTTALRELAEETGIRVSDEHLVGPIWRRVARFTFLGQDYQQTEFYFAARLPGPVPVGHAGRQSSMGLIAGPAGALRQPTVSGARTMVEGVDIEAVSIEAVGIETVNERLDGSGRTEVERRTLTGDRWWTLEALVASDESIYPLELPSRLPEARDALRAGVAPASASPIA